MTLVFIIPPKTPSGSATDQVPSFTIDDRTLRNPLLHGQAYPFNGFT